MLGSGAVYGIADLLRLLYGATARYATVSVTGRYRSDEALHERAFRRWVARQQPGSVAGLEPVGGGPAPPPPVSVRERAARLWERKPSLSRYEYDDARGTVVRVARGDIWWVDHPRSGRDTNAGVPDPERIQSPVQDEVGIGELLDPVAVIPDLWLDPVGLTEHAGRRAIRVRGRPRRDLAMDLSSGLLRLGADEHELLVDAERGTVLRCSAFLDGAEFYRVEVMSIAFDEAIPDAVFTHNPAR